MENVPAHNEKKTPPVPERTDSAKKEKKFGILKGCLIAVLVFLLLLGGLVAAAFRVPEKLGIVKSKTEKLYDVDNADRYVAGDLRAALEQTGIATEGMEIYVLPLKDGSGSGAYVVLDESSGFSFSPSGGGDPFLGTLAALATSEAVKEGGVKYVAFEYKDKAGRSLITVGASVQDGADFANGTISREEFMAKVGGQADLQNVSAAIQEILQ